VITVLITCRDLAAGSCLKKQESKRNKKRKDNKHGEINNMKQAGAIKSTRKQ
jgi:hypothetical protein